MDFDTLRTFVTVVRCGSFSEAARELQLSQPGVSRQVQRLERELGALLVDRGGARCRPTAAGELALRWAEETLGRERELHGILNGGPLLQGELRIASSSTPAEFFVPDVVASFVQAHPDVHPTVAIMSSSAVEEAVREHRYDLGFFGAPLAERGLRYRPVVEDEVVLAVPASHPFARKGTIELEDLRDQPLIEREGGSGTAACVVRALAERGLESPPVRTVMSLGSSAAIVSAAERGLGMGWVSSLALSCRSKRRVAAVRLRGLPIRRVLSLVDDPRRSPSLVAEAFSEWVAAWQPTPCPGSDTPRGAAANQSNGRRRAISGVS